MSARSPEQAGDPDLLVCELHEGFEETALVLAVGEIDLSSVAALAGALAEAAARGAEILLDLHGVTFCDCTGLHAIIDADEQARQAGGRLMISRARPQMRRLLEITGLDSRFDIARGESYLIPRTREAA